jgi:transcriptional regulator with XRE-family HTH domain
VEGTVFSERLRQAIALAGTSQARLADSLCTARSAVNNWVKGKDMPAGMRLADVAVALNTTTDFLLGVDRLRPSAPPAPIDLAHAMAALPITWAGSALTPAERRRAFVILHGLLEREERLGNLPTGWQERFAPNANEARDRATLIAAVPHRRPRRGRQGSAGVVGDGSDGGGA